MISDRNLEVFRRYNEGILPEELYKDYGFSKQRLFQILSQVEEETGLSRRVFDRRGKVPRNKTDAFWGKLYHMYTYQGMTSFDLFMLNKRRHSIPSIVSGIARYRKKHGLAHRKERA